MTWAADTWSGQLTAVVSGSPGYKVLGLGVSCGVEVTVCEVLKTKIWGLEHSVSQPLWMLDFRIG